MKFLRIVCPNSGKKTEIALVSWYAAPEYPDGDPLLVKIDLDSEPPEGLPPFLFLKEIDPSPVMYELDLSDREMYMMRLRGLDINPAF